MPMQEKLPKSVELIPADAEQVTKFLFSVRQANLMFIFIKLQGRTFTLHMVEENVICLIRDLLPGKLQKALEGKMRSCPENQDFLSRCCLQKL